MSAVRVRLPRVSVKRLATRPGALCTDGPDAERACRGNGRAAEACQRVVQRSAEGDRAHGVILVRVFGNSPDFWLTVQRTDLWQAMHSPKERERIKRAKPLQSAALSLQRPWAIASSEAPTYARLFLSLSSKRATTRSYAPVRTSSAASLYISPPCSRRTYSPRASRPPYPAVSSPTGCARFRLPSPSAFELIGKL